MRILLILVISLCVGGFFAYQKVGRVEKEIASIHRMFDARQFDEIYDGADELLKQSVSREAMVGVFERNRRVLGTTVSSKRNEHWAFWFWRRGVTGIVIEQGYSTTYERGRVDEIFTFRVEGRKARLLNYQFNGYEE